MATVKVGQIYRDRDLREVRKNARQHLMVRRMDDTYAWLWNTETKTERVTRVALKRLVSNDYELTDESMVTPNRLNVDEVSKGDQLWRVDGTRFLFDGARWVRG